MELCPSNIFDAHVVDVLIKLRFSLMAMVLPKRIPSVFNNETIEDADSVKSTVIQLRLDFREILYRDDFIFSVS